MKTHFEKISKVELITPEWDNISSNYFQKKEFLTYCEIYNPCSQRYYMAYTGDALTACAVVYSLRLDLLTYIKLKSPVRMNIIGIPCSVSSPGVFGDPNIQRQLIDYIYQSEKGLKLTLNIPESVLDNSYASGNTLPTIVFRNKFNSWNNYLESLRSDYRRRLFKIINGTDGCIVKNYNFSSFTSTMYDQYLEVYKKSKGKLEKLSQSFFRNLKSPFSLTVCEYNGRPLGWTIALSQKDRLYFFLGGTDYALNRRFSTYFRLLFDILKKGIELNASYIDFGQTAEIPKLRLGGKSEPLFMEGQHANQTINQVLKKFEKSLQYEWNTETPNVFNKMI